MTSPSEARCCLNCDTRLTGAFCHVCGQSADPARSLRALGRDLELLAVHSDSRLWRTLPLLIRSPGDLTRRYVHGQRARFVSPTVLFLFAVFLMFLAVNQVTAPGVARLDAQVRAGQALLVDAAGDAALRVATLKAEKHALRAADPHADTRGIDRRIVHAQRDTALLARLTAGAPTGGSPSKQRRAPTAAMLAAATGGLDGLPPPLDAIAAAVHRDPGLAVFKIKAASYKFSWLLIPISAPLIGLLFWRRRDTGLYDHAIFAIHSLSFHMLMATALIGLDILGLPTVAVWAAAVLLSPIHLYRHLKGAYVLGRSAAAWRAGVLLVLTVVAVVLFFSLMFWLELT